MNFVQLQYINIDIKTTQRDFKIGRQIYYECKLLSKRYKIENEKLATSDRPGLSF